MANFFSEVQPTNIVYNSCQTWNSSSKGKIHNVAIKGSVVVAVSVAAWSPNPKIAGSIPGYDSLGLNL